jgi:hypothetical protein
MKSDNWNVPMMSVTRKSKITAFFITLILIIPVCALAGPVPDTGQTKCYDNSAGITCPNPGEAFYGQDANYSINPPSYTKLDASGNDLPDSATSWPMVRDNVTGLIWEVKTDDGSVHDKNNKYTLDAAQTVFVANINSSSFGGYSDWRLPTIKELNTISNRGSFDLKSYFPNIDTTDSTSAYYWSNTQAAFDTNLFWCFRYYHSGVTPSDNTFPVHVRAVRGNQFVNNFIDNGNNTVTDLSTGLMWQQVPQGDGTTWEESLNYSENLNHGGYNDWRLPNINELISITDFSKPTLTIDTNYFFFTDPGGTGPVVCSSTTYHFNRQYAWGVRLDRGYVGTDWCKKTSSPPFVAVRGGQNRLLGHLVISAPQQADRWIIGCLNRQMMTHQN